jgi:hypothetical protein
MRIIKKIIISTAFLIALILPVVTKAQQAGIQISPVTYNFDIKPGDSQTAQITITNLNSTQLNYIIEIENFASVSDDGAPSFAGTQDDATVTGLKDWFVIASADKEGSIESKKEKQIQFMINVPKGAEPGGHYAAIFAKEVKKTEEGKTDIAVTSRVGTLILVSVAGDVKKSAEIAEFKSPKFVWKGPVDFSMKVKNSGTTHFDSATEVKIKPIFGAISTVDMGKHTIIPQNLRNYEGKWSKRFPFGYYQLTAQALDGNGNPVTTTVVLWAIPLEIVIPALLALIIIILIVKYVRRHFKVVKQ